MYKSIFRGVIKIQNTNFAKDSVKSITAVIITVLWYGMERVVEVFMTLSKSQSIALACISTAMVALVYYLISETKSAYAGMLASMVAFKMMPPSITFSGKSTDAAFLYYIVTKIAVVLFIFQFIKHYSRQEKKSISAINAFIIAGSVPFLMSIAQNVGHYFMVSMGASMLSLYFSQFACYILCILIAWIIAVRGDYHQFIFITNYELVVFCINVLRRGTLIVLNLTNGEHVSLSLYCWIVIFVAGIALFGFTYSFRKKDEQKIDYA